jgi:hypothetical protein
MGPRVVGSGTDISCGGAARGCCGRRTTVVLRELLEPPTRDGTGQGHYHLCCVSCRLVYSFHVLLCHYDMYSFR